ncbi:hypothetical protein CANCADRAFT_18068, partial [Tortispora caseinolytica NRRL Y-17796]
RYVVVSGGSACNSLVPVFSTVADTVTYILPISDNGGSTSEILRVIGGPGIGDIRSRLTRLIPDSAAEIRALMSYRLPDDPHLAKLEWLDIIDGVHPLWSAFDSARRELLRAFFIHVNVEIGKRTRPARQFRFQYASVGNLFLTAARLFSGSLASAIELFSRVCCIPENHRVLSCLNTNFSHHISALLTNGQIITGQSQISHPSAEDDHDTSEEPIMATTRVATPAPHSPARLPHRDSARNFHHDLSARMERVSVSSRSHSLTPATERDLDDDDDDEDAHPPFTHPSLRKSQLHYSKAGIMPLSNPISRVYYINPYGQEIRPKLSQLASTAIKSADILVYAIGSLYTSILPVVILDGFSEATKNSSIKQKVLLINGQLDRETGSVFDCFMYVKAIIKGCIYSSDEFNATLSHSSPSNE